MMLPNQQDSQKSNQYAHGLQDDFVILIEWPEEIWKLISQKINAYKITTYCVYENTRIRLADCKKLNKLHIV